MAIISYIVFDNEDDAIKFHQEILKTDSNNLTTYGTLVASYKMPTLFCNQLDPFPHKQDGWTFRSTRGWWVCPICLRPSGFNLKNGKRIFELDGIYGFDISEKIRSANIGDKL